jgi:hypothetical protein
MALMLGVAALEARWLADAPWSGALVVVEPPFEAGSAGVSARMRQAPASAYPPSAFAEAMQAAPPGDEALDLAALFDATEPVLFVELPPDAFSPLLASGRLPVAGAPELLAGPHSQLTEIPLGDRVYRVVGRLHPTVSVGHFAYLLPAHADLAADFGAEAGGVPAVLLPEGRAALAGLMAGVDATERMPQLLGHRYPTRRAFAWATWLGLALMALGGLQGVLAWFSRWARGARWFGALYREALARPGLFLGMHAFLYGLLFLAMAQGMSQPLLQHQLGRMVEAMFAYGGLSYIGEAYASGNILWAAVTTWWNNYVVQTLGLTFFTPFALWGMGALPWLGLAPLLWPLPLGVLKTAASFGLVGLVMAPSHAHTASGYWYHGVTMVLELEAYIVACFVVAAWPLVLAGGVLRGETARGATAALRLLGAGVGFTGVLLAVAGLYEAVTLILLR